MLPYLLIVANLPSSLKIAVTLKESYLRYLRRAFPHPRHHLDLWLILRIVKKSLK